MSISLQALTFLVLGFVVPPPLGSYAAERDDGTVRSQPSTLDYSSELPPGDVELTLTDYHMRALFDDGSTLQGRTVSLVGFVSASDSGGEWSLTRMKLSCCAADAYAVKVDVRRPSVSAPRGPGTGC